MNALCKFLLNGSIVSALALGTIAVGCSSSNKDDANDTPGSAGQSSSSRAGSSSNGNMAGASEVAAAGASAMTSGGATGAGGSQDDAAGSQNDAGGAADAAAGAGAGGAAADGIATAKFCNSLQYETADTTMILKVGEGADAVTFTAVTGECAPPDGAACQAIPTGPDVLVQLFDADAPDTALDFGPLAISGGEQWFFYSNVDADQQPVWNAGRIKQDVASCEELTFADVP